MNVTVYATIGVFIRLSAGAIAFGMWQQSVSAGVFAYFLLATLELKKD
jgi:hypothetical protein